MGEKILFWSPLDSKTNLCLCVGGIKVTEKYYAPRRRRRTHMFSNMNTDRGGKESGDSETWQGVCLKKKVFSIIVHNWLLYRNSDRDAK